MEVCSVRTILWKCKRYDLKSHIWTSMRWICRMRPTATWLREKLRDESTNVCCARKCVMVIWWEYFNWLISCSRVHWTLSSIIQLLIIVVHHHNRTNPMLEMAQNFSAKTAGSFIVNMSVLCAWTCKKINFHFTSIRQWDHRGAHRSHSSRASSQQSCCMH